MPDLLCPYMAVGLLFNTRQQHASRKQLPHALCAECNINATYAAKPGTANGLPRSSNVSRWGSAMPRGMPWETLPRRSSRSYRECAPTTSPKPIAFVAYSDACDHHNPRVRSTLMVHGAPYPKSGAPSGGITRNETAKPVPRIFSISRGRFCHMLIWTLYCIEQAVKSPCENTWGDRPPSWHHLWLF